MLPVLPKKPPKYKKELLLLALARYQLYTQLKKNLMIFKYNLKQFLRDKNRQVGNDLKTSSKFNF